MTMECLASFMSLFIRSFSDSEMPELPFQAETLVKIAKTEILSENPPSPPFAKGGEI